MLDGFKMKSNAPSISASVVTLAPSAVKLLTVFPFDFEPYSFPWEVMVRVVLGIAILGMTIGLIVNVVTTIRRIVR